MVQTAEWVGGGRSACHRAPLRQKPKLYGNQTFHACSHPWLLWDIAHEALGERKHWGYKFPKEDGVIFPPFGVCVGGGSSAPSRLLLVAQVWGRGERRGANEVFLIRQWLGVGWGQKMEKWLVSLRLVLLFSQQAKNPLIKGVFWLCDFICAKKEEEQRQIPKPWLLLGRMKSVCLS